MRQPKNPPIRLAGGPAPLPGEIPPKPEPCSGVVDVNLGLLGLEGTTAIETPDGIRCPHCGNWYAEWTIASAWMRHPVGGQR
jgi:hypothetical protein